MTDPSRNTVSLGLYLLLFPVLVNVIATVGFLLGCPIGKIHGVLALFLTIGIMCIVPAERATKKRLIRNFLFTLFFSIVVSGLWVMCSSTDATAYHRPATFLLARGWNPVFDSTINDVLSMVASGVRPWHIAYLPHAGWVYGAVLYKWFGFIEITDSLNVLAFMISILFVSHWLKGLLFTYGARLAFTGFICFSPIVCSGIVSGDVDSALYSFQITAIVSACSYLANKRNEYLFSVAMALALTTGLKYTGVMNTGLLFIIFGCAQLIQCFGFCLSKGILQKSCRDRVFAVITSFVRGWGLMCICCCLLIGVIGFSPYVTSWIRHGGPFYPFHSFDKRVMCEDKITFDFGDMNEDAKKIGYCGRFACAYLSKEATLSYYRWKLNKSKFEPAFGVPDGVDGFGIPFRIAFCISLVGVFFIQCREIKIALLYVLCSVLIQPTCYSGYMRYVPQFYLFPVLCVVGLLNRFLCVSTCKSIWQRVGIVVVCIYATVLLLRFSLGGFLMRGVISVQNVKIISIMKTDFSPVIVCGDKLSYYMRTTLQDDYNIRPFAPAQSPVSPFAQWYIPCSTHYSYLSPQHIARFPELYSVVLEDGVAILDPKTKKTSIPRFFLISFLPDAILELPSYLWTVGRWRCCQFISCLGAK